MTDSHDPARHDPAAEASAADVAAAGNPSDPNPGHQGSGQGGGTADQAAFDPNYTASDPNQAAVTPDQVPFDPKQAAFDPSQGGYAPPVPYPAQPSYPPPGYEQAGGAGTPTGQPPYPQPDYSQAPYPQPAYPQPGNSQPDNSQAPYSQPDYSQAPYPQAAYGQPTGQPPYGQPSFAPPGQDPNQYGYPPPYPGPTPPKKSRKTLWIALAVAAVVIVGGGITAVAVSSGKHSATADGAVKDYLTALAASDAKAALALVQTQPASATFATNEVLGKQQAIAKLANIKVEKGVGSATRTTVHATYTFGTQNVDENYTVSKLGDKWKLASGTIPIDVSSVESIPGLTLFGTPVKGSGKVYVFPGPLKWGTSNANYTVTNKDADKFALSPDDSANSFFTLDDDLSDAGQQKVTTAVNALVQTCLAVKSLEPDNCPQRVYDYEGVDGTATWTLTTPLESVLKYQIDDSSPDSVQVRADLKWAVSYQAKDFAGAVTAQTDTDESYLSGDVDLSASPPTFKSD